LSASTSCNTRAAELLSAVRRGEFPPENDIRALGETCPGEFFREVVEPLADSFEPSQALAYERLMRAWIPSRPAVMPVIPSRVDTVYVLSRVTLGADIKIVSPILATMEGRFPDARIVFVANRKSAELFEGEVRVEHLNAEYPRSGPVSARLEFAHELRSKLETEHCIVVDPDSRMTQLGLIPVCAPERYFHFPSRTIGGTGGGNLSDLVRQWLRATFGIDAGAFIVPPFQPLSNMGPKVAVSLGVGDNESKRIGGDFEARLLGALGSRYNIIWVDRGVGGEETQRVTAAVEQSGVADRVRYWEGGFAEFTSIILQCDQYVGYDSAGQHAAAAVYVPVMSIFAGAPSERFRERWAAAGIEKCERIVADGMTPDAILNAFVTWMQTHRLE
jgi:ADP-heptose:LPS heptosyltransferase